MSSSMFELKTDASQLASANGGMSRLEYTQVSPMRPVSGTSFPGSSIEFRFTVSGDRWFCPASSYLRMRLRIDDAAGALLRGGDGVGLNMNAMASMFNTAEFRIGGKTVSRVDSYLPQVSTLLTRTKKSGAWLNSVGKSVSFLEPSVEGRIGITADGGVRPSGYATASKILASDISAGAGGATNIMTYTASSPGALVPTDAITGDELAKFREYCGNGTTAAANEGHKKYNIVLNALTATSTGAVTGESIKLPLLAINNAGTAIVVGTPDVPLVATVVVATAAGGWYIEEVDEGFAAPTRNSQFVELLWQPPLSILSIDHCLPSGEYSLHLTPQPASVYKTAMVESLYEDRVYGTDYDISVQDLYFYANEVLGPRVDNATYLLDLQSLSCQGEGIAGTANSEQKEFTVLPSTTDLCVAFQDIRAGNQTSISNTKFKIVQNNASAGQTPNREAELALNRLYLSFGGLSKPVPESDGYYDADADTDYLMSRYVNTQLDTGAFFDNGGSEDIQEWTARGAYYWFAWPRSGEDRSTRAVVHYGWNSNIGTSGRILLFSTARQVARVVIQDSRVVSLDLQDD